MSWLGLVRPDDENLPLFVHVLGASILVGGLLTGASLLGFARGSVSMLRFGYWTMLAVALPGLVLMRIGAEWIYRTSVYDDLEDEPTWIMIGGVTADIGGALFLVSLAVGGFGIYRLREGKGDGLLKATMVIGLILLAAYVVAVWAMASKPD
jgi:hypothetical protein